MESIPLIQYAQAEGGVNIAYRVLGNGPQDLVWVPGLFIDLDSMWVLPAFVNMFRHWATFSRFISFDKRGIGLSDRNISPPTLEDRIDDVRAVLEAVGSERATLIGVSEGGPMSMLFAATYPERTDALVLYGTTACLGQSDSHPEGVPWRVQRLYEIFEHGWGTGRSLEVCAPSLLGDERAREFMARAERSSGSPGTMRAFVDTIRDIDVRAILPSISVPTLVLHASDDIAMPIAEGRLVAASIPGATFAEIAGEHAQFDTDDFSTRIEAFMTGQKTATQTDRVLSTVLFTDIVGSTELAARVGDRRWTELLAAHNEVIRNLVGRHRGRLVKSIGDGVLAMFDGPARAVTCACAVQQSVQPLGLSVRAGLHTGEVEVLGDDIGGIAVHIGARVAAEARPGEVLVTRTVTDLVAGSGLVFEDRGAFDLKGLPDRWQLFAVSA